MSTQNQPEPEGANNEANEIYDKFIKSGLAVGFTDDQIDFLEQWIFRDEPIKQFMKSLKLNNPMPNTNQPEPETGWEERLRTELWYLFQKCRSKQPHTNSCNCMSGEGDILVNFIRQTIAAAEERTAREAMNGILDIIQDTDWIEEPKSAFGRLNKMLATIKEKYEL